MKLKYKLKQILPNIYAVVVKDRYDRGMLFCRAQEYYESPNPEIRDSKFSFWDYHKWYSIKHKGFTYSEDFAGYNLPVPSIIQCYNINKAETPYDVVMLEILNKVLKLSGEDSYLIGVQSVKGCLYKHEIAHAFYFLNPEYRKSADAITDSLTKKQYSTLVKNLKKLQYSEKVIDDEIQAYFSTEIHKDVSKGVNGAKRIHEKFKKNFKKFYEQL